MKHLLNVKLILLLLLDVLRKRDDGLGRKPISLEHQIRRSFERRSGTVEAALCDH